MAERRNLSAAEGDRRQRLGRRVAEADALRAEGTVLVVGNTLRKETPESEGISQQVIRNRERARHMDMRYVVFLSLCAMMTVVICVHYLKLHAQYTYLQKQSSSLTLELNNLKMENDTVYNEIVSSVDLEKVKDRAVNDLGMTYPKQSQIVYYETPDSDYVRQYGEIDGGR